MQQADFPLGPQFDGQLTALVRAIVEPLGYELLGVEQRGGRHPLVRVYIDREEGVTLDDCALVSHQLSGEFDVADPIPGQYDLEVSSPGLDRPLFTRAQIERFGGQRARVRLTEKRGGRRNFEGVLAGVVNDELQLALDDGDIAALPLAMIESARLVPEF
jgi:ribosome maturation factor RimP